MCALPVRLLRTVTPKDNGRCSRLVVTGNPTLPVYAGGKYCVVLSLDMGLF